MSEIKLRLNKVNLNKIKVEQAVRHRFIQTDGGILAAGQIIIRKPVQRENKATSLLARQELELPRSLINK
jgi:hypothetical protein